MDQLGTVLLSSFQLCEQIAEQKLEFLNLNESTETEEQVVHILTSTIAEIISGLEKDTTLEEQHELKLTLCNVFINLSIEQEAEVNILSTSCMFPRLSLDLVLKVVSISRLEIHFVYVISSLPSQIQTNVIQAILSRLTAHPTSVEYSRLSHCLALYLFVHKNTALRCTDEHLSLTSLQTFLPAFVKLLTDAFDEDGVVLLSLLNILALSRQVSLVTFNVFKTNVFGFNPRSQKSSLKRSNREVTLKAKEKFEISSSECNGVLRTMSIKSISGKLSIHKPTLKANWDCDAVQSVVASSLQGITSDTNLVQAVCKRLNSAMHDDKLFLGGSDTGEARVNLAIALMKHDSVPPTLKKTFESWPFFSLLQKSLEIKAPDEFFSLYLVVISERLDDWQLYFQRLLTDSCSVTSDPRWLACLRENFDQLKLQPRALWEKLVSIATIGRVTTQIASLNH